MRNLILLLLALMPMMSSSQQFLMDWQVETSSGSIQGFIDNSTGTPVQAFLGIPYAEPPIKSLRFLRPIPVFRWSDILLATSRGPACIQPSSNYPWSVGVEDQDENCLHLNVWAPITASEGSKKAVMFYIFGGDFTIGSNNAGEGHIYDGDMLAQYYDVIVVTVNYRVGVLGFGTSGTDDAPGNNGMYDLHLALKWIHRNIPAFGGDPKRITVFGQGSGSVAASLLMFSPSTKNLFSSAILMSGTVSSLPKNQTERNIQLTQKFADAVGCYADNFTIQTDPEGVFDCLREADPFKLSSAVYVDSFNPRAPTSFYPQYGDEILPKNVALDLHTGNIDGINVLMGVDFSEGTLQLATAYPDVFDQYAGASPEIEKDKATDMLKGIFRDFENPDAIVDYYLGPIYDGNYTQILREMSFAVGDYKILCPAVYFAENVGNNSNSNVYFYLHSYAIQRRPTYARWIGVPTFSEVQLVFGQPWKPDFFHMYSNKDRNMSMTMMMIWTQFAKFGLPPNSFEWPQYSAVNHDYIFPYFNVRYLLTSGPHLQNCNYFRDYFVCMLMKSLSDEDRSTFKTDVNCSSLPESSSLCEQSTNNRTFDGTPIYFRDAYVIEYPYN